MSLLAATFSVPKAARASSNEGTMPVLGNERLIMMGVATSVFGTEVDAGGGKSP